MLRRLLAPACVSALALVSACKQEPPPKPPRPGQFLEGRYIIISNSMMVNVRANTMEFTGGNIVGSGGRLESPPPMTWGWGYVDGKRLVIDKDPADDKPGAVCFYSYKTITMTSGETMTDFDIEDCTDGTSLPLTLDAEWLHRKL